MRFLSNIIKKLADIKIENDDLEVEYEDFDEDEDDIPPGCAACGGPYPNCTTSCKLFDD